MSVSIRPSCTHGQRRWWRWARPTWREFDEPEGHWITLLDPEGNEFCLH